MGFDVSPAALLLSELTGTNADRWEIVECEFVSNLTVRKNPNAVPAKFLVFSDKSTFGAGMSIAHDFGGRRKVRYLFPYRDGQTTDDLGRKPETFELNCLIFGPQYREGLRLLLRECEQPSPGVLVHPVRGHMYVAIEDYELTHSADTRRAVTVKIRFTEQSFTLDSINTLAPGAGRKSALKTALVAALNGVKLVNGVITTVNSNIAAARAILGRLRSALGGYNSAYAVNLQRLNRTFNTQSGSQDLPTLLPVNDGGVAKPDGTLASQTFPVVGTANDPFTGFPAVPDQNLLQAVATQQAIDSTNALRDQVSAIIAQLESVTPSDLGETNPDVAELTKPVGSLVFRQSILDLKETAALMADALNTGLASSQFRIVDFTTPRLMSVREAAFAAGLSVDLSYQVEILNPQLLSVNYIPKGTKLRIPVPAA